MPAILQHPPTPISLTPISDLSDAGRLAAFDKLRREEESLEERRALGPARAEWLRWKRMMGGAKGPEKAR